MTLDTDTQARLMQEILLGKASTAETDEEKDFEADIRQDVKDSAEMARRTGRKAAVIEIPFD